MAQKLLTKSIEKQLMNRPIGSTESDKSAKAICKFFNPYGAGTWWVLEGEKLPDGDWEFFGIAEIWEKEYGYFRLSELESARVRVFGESFPLERDKYYEPQTAEEIFNS